MHHPERWIFDWFYKRHDMDKADNRFYRQMLRAALNGGNVIERLQFALQRLADAADTLGVNHFGDDWLSDEVQELQAATRAARLVLGPNVRVQRAPPREGVDHE